MPASESPLHKNEYTALPESGTVSDLIGQIEKRLITRESPDFGNTKFLAEIANVIVGWQVKNNFLTGTMQYYSPTRDEIVVALDTLNGNENRSNNRLILSDKNELATGFRWKITKTAEAASE